MCGPQGGLKCLRGGAILVYISKMKSKDADLLCDAMLSLQNREECYRFFDDLLTTGEFSALGQRIAVAKMLLAEEKYSDIAEKTGASTATISRVKRCVSFGADGYACVLSRIGGEDD